MKSPLLALFGLALLLAACDGTAQEGTSSETQTALRLLADNAGAMATKLQPATDAPAGAARTLAATADPSSEARLCKGSSWSVYSGPGQVFHRAKGPGVGSDSTNSTCSVRFSRHDFQEFWLDTIGLESMQGTYWQKDSLQVQSLEGAGTWKLRSGLTLDYRHISTYYTPRVVTSEQLIQIPGNCQIDAKLRDTLVDTGWINSGIDAPIVCDGRTIGRFLYDQVHAPRVVDLSGRIVHPRPVAKSSFPEDRLGLNISGFGAGWGTDTTFGLTLDTYWRLLPGDSIPVGSTFKLYDDLSGSLIDSTTTPNDSGATLRFSVPRKLASGGATLIVVLPRGTGGARLHFDFSY